jgi:hypothetical protein
LVKSDVDLGRSFDVGIVKVPIVIPLFVTMVMCALQLELRYGENNVGLVTKKGVEILGSIIV